MQQRFHSYISCFTLHLCLQPKFFKGKYQDSLTMFELPLQVATEREIARQQYSLAGQQPLSDWTVRLKGFPHPALSANSLVGQVIGPFLFAASMFSYVPVVGLSRCTLQAPLCLPYWCSVSLFCFCLHRSLFSCRPDLHASNLIRSIGLVNCNTNIAYVTQCNIVMCGD